MRSVLVVAYAVMVAVAVTPAAAQAPADVGAVPSTVALVESYADGRTVYELVSTRPAKMWTSHVPRVKGYQRPAGELPFFAVQIARVLVGDNVRVNVSVLLGSPRGQEVQVADLLIAPGTSVVVDALARFGVEPMTLSMATVASLTAYLPTVVSVTPSIEIAGVELLTQPYPGYRITLRNLSPRAVSNVHVQSYRGEDRAMSALRRDDSGRPLMTAGAVHTFDLNLTSGEASPATPPGTWSPRPLDLIEIDAVRWEDGSYDGLPPFPQIDPLIEGDGGRRAQLLRIVEVLRQVSNSPASGEHRLAALRSQIEALPAAEPDRLVRAQGAMRATRMAILADIGRFEAARSGVHDSSAVAEWLTDTLRRYEAWLKRISPVR